MPTYSEMREDSAGNLSSLIGLLIGCVDTARRVLCGSGKARNGKRERPDLLSMLPLELRHEVYHYVIQPFGKDMHIFQCDGRYTNCACVTDHGVTDGRQEAIETLCAEQPIRARRYYSPLWRKRLASTWANHFRCEEAFLEDTQRAAPTK
jgi:hypothetical protein